MAYLGNIFIAIGNALPDGLTLISLSKLGEAKMGITGSLGTSLFAFLIGFGVSCIVAIGKSDEGYIPFDLFSSENLSKNKVFLIAIIISISNQLIGIINGVSNGFKLKKFYGLIQLGLYLISFCTMTGMVIVQKFF